VSLTSGMNAAAGGLGRGVSAMGSASPRSGIGTSGTLDEV
jgi:hypothetical protein